MISCCKYGETNHWKSTVQQSCLCRVRIWAACLVRHFRAMLLEQRGVCVNSEYVYRKIIRNVILHVNYLIYNVQFSKTVVAGVGFCRGTGSYRSRLHTVRTPASYCVDVHPLSIRDKLWGKAHVLGNKGLFDDAVTGERSGLALETQGTDVWSRQKCRLSGHSSSCSVGNFNSRVSSRAQQKVSRSFSTLSKPSKERTGTHWCIWLLFYCPSIVFLSRKGFRWVTLLSCPSWLKMPEREC